MWKTLGSLVRKSGQAVDELGLLLQGKLGYRETGEAVQRSARAISAACLYGLVANLLAARLPLQPATLCLLTEAP